MGKSSYAFDNSPPPQGQDNQACELTRVSSQSKDRESTSGYDIKDESTATAEPEMTHNGLPPGVKPGEKGDPFRKFRYIKQLCLIGTWMSIVSCADIIHLFLREN